MACALMSSYPGETQSVLAKGVVFIVSMTPTVVMTVEVERKEKTRGRMWNTET